MAYQDLIILCLYSLPESSSSCAFDDLMAECFREFPDKFSFVKYSQWPDARKLDRALRGLRAEEQIKGNPNIGFSLTRKGVKKAQQLNKLFRQEKLF
jgi:hypothetical protein